jgi:hypothetical protein
MSWEEAIYNGLVQSRVFMPILSRHSINHPTDPTQNFAMLTADSPCDNVLLEYLLALEMSTRGLVEKIYPIMIGDLSPPDDDGLRIYAHYLLTSCQPNLASEEDSIEVASVTRKCEYHLNRSGYGTSLLSNMTVSRILKTILGNQGRMIVGIEQEAFDPIVNDAKTMIRHLKGRPRRRSSYA